MKSLIICMFATFATVTLFAQKAIQDQPTVSTDTSTTTVYYCTMHPDYISFAAGKCPVCGENLSKKEVMKAEVVKLYTCPMDNVICTKPGKCPKCGMTMVAYTPKKKQ
jgi:hypothetical protein